MDNPWFPGPFADSTFEQSHLLVDVVEQFSAPEVTLEVVLFDVHPAREAEGKRVEGVQADIFPEVANFVVDVGVENVERHGSAEHVVMVVVLVAGVVVLEHT